MDVKLVLPYNDPHYAQEVYSFIREFEEAGEKLIPHGLHYGETDFEKMIRRSREFERGINLPSHMVRSTTCWLVRGADRRIVGACNIRHRLNEFLLNEGGHIGYGVRPGERRKGYATQMLALALAWCGRELGLEQALVTCDKINTGSARTIQKNGGVLEDEREVNGKLVQRYWVPVPEECPPSFQL